MWHYVTENPSSLRLSASNGELKEDVESRRVTHPTIGVWLTWKNMGLSSAGVDGGSDSDTRASMHTLKAETVFVIAGGDEGVCNTCLQKQPVNERRVMLIRER